MTTIALKEDFTGNTVLAAVILMGSVGEAKIKLGEEDAYRKFSPAFDFCMMVLDREVKN